MITVYHGGTAKVEKPLAKIGRKNLDFGQGFINGTIDEEHALAELSKHQPNNQICVLNQDIIDNCLKFIRIL